MHRDVLPNAKDERLNYNQEITQEDKDAQYLDSVELPNEDHRDE
jgi:hypothetical protein